MLGLQGVDSLQAEERQLCAGEDALPEISDPRHERSVFVIFCLVADLGSLHFFIPCSLSRAHSLSIPVSLEQLASLAS